MPRPELGQVGLAGQDDRRGPQLAALGPQRRPDAAVSRAGLDVQRPPSARGWSPPPRSTAWARPRTSRPGVHRRVLRPVHPAERALDPDPLGGSGGVEHLVVLRPSPRRRGSPSGASSAGSWLGPRATTRLPPLT